MKFLFIIKVIVFELIKWSYGFSQLCSLLNLEWSTDFEHVVQSLLSVYLFGVRR